MSNQINELSPEIRDFLLNRNLIVSDTVSNNGLSNLSIGLGLQAQIQDLSNSIQASEDLEVSGVDYREGLVSRNQYLSPDDMVQATIINNSYSYNQVYGGYIENNGELNLGGPSTDALDVITSITSQEGFGLGEGGFTPQNNINTSITGRILGGVGAINDTPLGIIGGQQLLLAFKQKLSFNTQRELFGKVNLQPFSLLRGADFVNPDYSITVSSSTGGRILDTALDLSGFELPSSKLDAGASIFEDTDLFQMDSIQRNNAMIKNTGKGQILRLFELLNNNKFKPDYESDRDDSRLGIQDAAEYKEENFLVGPEQAISISSSEPVDEVGDALWSNSTLLLSTDNSLISKTKALFENNDINLYDGMFGRDGIQDLSTSNRLTTPNSKEMSSDKWLSKGSGVLSEEFLNGGGVENIFCRTWTSKVSYDNIQALQKNKGLQGSNTYPNQFRRNEDRSVLDSNGFVKISPYNLPDDVKEDANYAKKFMFSIENLAWNDEIYNVPNFETGPGDPISGVKGRIMWFPPYDMKFEESTSVNWDSSEFIGRGEPIYTYNNTVRSGTLSWKIIIDHPNYLNDLTGVNSDQIIASIVAGCSEYKTFFSPNEIDQIVNEVNSAVPAGKETVANIEPAPEPIEFFFPNDVGTLSDVYEITGESYGQIPSEGFNATAGTLYDNGPNQGLNDFWNDQGNINSIKDFLFLNDGYKLVLNSYASAAGNSADNKRLSDLRIDSVRIWLLENIDSNIRISEANSNGSSESEPDPTLSANTQTARSERKVTVEFVYDPALDKKITEQVEVPTEPRQIDKNIVAKVKRRFHKESDYFEKLGSSTSGSDKFIYKTIKEKIRFFQPAFHSTTPEGFNSRLTFLQQCTRQGPTEVERRASNLAFGAPPVCILRIGDFYNTKIIIESLNFKFEPLVWDLNPEGVGVQPMIANVSMSFKFIGGSSLTGPINRLQNAVSFNYFANTEVYDPRADVIVPVDNGEGFRISGGTKNLRDFLDENEYINKIDKSSNVKLDNVQTAVAEKENEGVAPQPSSGSTSDLEILKDIAWTVTFNETGNPNTFSFTWNAASDLSNLNKEYQYIITIKNESGGQQQLITGTFNSSSNNTGDKTSANGWSQGIYGIGLQTFTLTFKGNGVYDRQIKIIDPETGLTP